MFTAFLIWIFLPVLDLLSHQLIFIGEDRFLTVESFQL
jgi:hypothetical protein